MRWPQVAIEHHRRGAPRWVSTNQMLHDGFAHLRALAGSMFATKSAQTAASSLVSAHTQEGSGCISNCQRPCLATETLN